MRNALRPTTFSWNAPFRRAFLVPTGKSAWDLIQSHPGCWESDKIFRQICVNIYNARLNHNEVMKYRHRLQNIMIKVDRWFWQGQFSGGIYDLPKGLKDLKKWAVFYSTPWGYRDKENEEVKFFDDLATALDFVANVQFHCVMDTDNNIEYTIKLTASIDDVIGYNMCCDTIIGHGHMRECITNV